MNLKLRSSIFVLLLFVSSTVLSAQSLPAGLPDISFPEVEGWRRGDKTPLPMGDTGYVLHYDSQSKERVSVYVLARGEKPGGAEFKGIVKQEFDGAIGAIRTVASAGVYTDLKELKDTVGSLGGEKGKVKAHWAVLSFSARGSRMNSEIFVFPYKDHVIKIRSTRPVDGADESAYRRLMGSLDSLFAG